MDESTGIVTDNALVYGDTLPEGGALLAAVELPRRVQRHRVDVQLAAVRH